MRLRKHKPGTNAFIGGTLEDFKALGLTDKQLEECYNKGISLEDADFAKPTKWHTVEAAYYMEGACTVVYSLLKCALAILTLPLYMLGGFFLGVGFSSLFDKLLKK